MMYCVWMNGNHVFLYMLRNLFFRVFHSILRVSTPKKPKRRLVVDEVEDVKTSGEDSGVSVEGGCSVGGGSAAGGSSREPGQDNK